MSLRLSICIPTHDGRADLLAEALESIATQIEAPARPVEICVFDNASQDHTAEMIAGFRARLGERLVYRRNDVDLGFRDNLFGAMAAATGDYLWMLGSDDKLAPGAVEEVLSLVERHPASGGFCVARRHFEAEPPYREYPDHPRYLPADFEREQAFHTTDEALLSFGHLQGYISTQIISREKWIAALEQTTPEDFVRARNYPHLEVIGRMMLQTPYWVWYPGELVLHRATTQPLEGQSGLGHAPFQAIDLTDRRAIWAHLFGEGSAAFKGLMFAAWRDHASLRPLIIYKSTPEHTFASDRLLLRAFPRLFGRLPRFWLISVPVLALFPHRLAKVVMPLYLRAVGAR